MRVRLAVLLLPFLVAPARATVHYVSASAPNSLRNGSSWQTAFRTVQEAVAASLPGDDVWVAAGSYAGPLTMRPGIAVYGGFAGEETFRDARNPTQHPTILTGGKAVRAVTIPSGSDNVTLDSLIIEAGVADYGAGIYCEGNSPTLSRLVVRNNVANRNGGGIWLRSVSPTVQRCQITGNNARYAVGGGIYCEGSDVRIVSNTVSDNSVGSVDDSAGGGIYLAAVSGRVANNLIVRNFGVADPICYGVGLCNTKPGVLIANNTIADNYFVQTYAQYFAGAGGIWDAGGATIVNNILAYNLLGLGRANPSQTPTHHNVLFANGRDDHPYNLAPTDNTVTDPRFADRAHGNYRLMPDSPCIDSGDDSVVVEGDTDAAGQPRRAGRHVDIGAFEFVPPPGYTVADATLALRLYAGLRRLDDVPVDRLNVIGTGSSTDRVDLLDVVALLRRALGTDTNPL